MTDTIKITAQIEYEIELPDWLRDTLAGKHPETAQPAPQPKSMGFPLPREMTDPMGVYVEQLAEFIKAAGTEGVTRQEINKTFRYRLTNNALRDIALSKLPEGFEKRNERYQASDIKRTRHRWFWVEDE